MKTVTAAFLKAQKKPDAIGARRIYYKRRIWDSGTSEYSWEAAWTEFDSRRFVTVSPVTMQLDSDQLNEFKFSNITLTVENQDNHFNFLNEDGFFGYDTASASFLYEPYWTKLQIQAGYKLADGTTEYATLFTGLATEYTFDSDSKTCQIVIRGMEGLLENTKAEDIATTVSTENIGTGDGSEVDFTTANPGVGGVRDVYVDAVKQIYGSDYNVSQLNESTLGAKITFTDPPDNGLAVTCDYYYWAQSQTVKATVEALLDAAGIPSGDQFVEDIIFPSDVLNEVTYTSKTDWDTGTLDDIDTAEVSGSIKIDIKNSDTQDTGWQNSTTGWQNVSSVWTSDGSKLKGTQTGGSTLGIWRDDTAIVGLWSFKYQRSAATTASPPLTFHVAGIYLNGFIQVRINHDHINVKGGTTIEEVDWTDDTSQHTIKIVRWANGLIYVYLDGAVIIDFTDTGTPGGGYLTLTVGLGSGTDYVEVDDILIPADQITAEWISPVIDTGLTLKNWGTLARAQETNNATITIYTATSADDITYDSYVAVTANGIVGSDLHRYVKIKIAFSGDSDTAIDPVVNEITFRYSTTSTEIILPDFSGQNVYEAIQSLGAFANYVFGFTPTEDFFFRPKADGVSVFVLMQNDWISSISGMQSGYERVYSIVRVTYGDITREVTDAGTDYDSPIKRIGSRRFDISPSSGVQVAPTADIATGVAQTYLDYLSVRRRRYKLTTKFLPQLDLEDVVTVTLLDYTPGVNPPTVDHRQFVYNKDARIIGARYDLMNFQCEFDCEELT